MADSPREPWRDTAATLHMWIQIVGKVRGVHMPWINHSWQVTLQPPHPPSTLPSAGDLSETYFSSTT